MSRLILFIKILKVRIKDRTGDTTYTTGNTPQTHEVRVENKQSDISFKLDLTPLTGSEVLGRG